MNCKPGDLAVIVDAPKASNALGRIVTVLRASSYEPIYVAEGVRHQGSAKWVVRANEPLIVKLGRDPFVTSEFIAPDSALRPIRDPGDEAKDETLSWLPVPQKEVA